MTDQLPWQPERILVPYITVLFLAVSAFAIWQIGAPLAEYLRLLPAKAVIEVPKDKH